MNGAACGESSRRGTALSLVAAGEGGARSAARLACEVEITSLRRRDGDVFATETRGEYRGSGGFMRDESTVDRSTLDESPVATDDSWSRTACIRPCRLTHATSQSSSPLSLPWPKR
jgi:hypothetical protein